MNNGDVIPPKKAKLMFVGSFKYSIDSKGRIALPAKLRKYVKPEANDTFILTRNPAKCIDVFPMDYWKELAENKLAKLNHFNPQDAMFIRTFLQEAAEDNLDAQSRLLIPKNLIEYAEIKNEVFILGALQKIEIWNPNVYNAYVNENLQSYQQITQDVMKNDD